MADEKTAPAKGIEEVLRERLAANPRAAQGAVTVTGDGTRIVFTATPEAPRLALIVKGDRITAEGA